MNNFQFLHSFLNSSSCHSKRLSWQGEQDQHIKIYKKNIHQHIFIVSYTSDGPIYQMELFLLLLLRIWRKRWRGNARVNLHSLKNEETRRKSQRKDKRLACKNKNTCEWDKAFPFVPLHGSTAIHPSNQQHHRHRSARNSFVHLWVFPTLSKSTYPPPTYGILLLYIQSECVVVVA